MSSKLFPNLYKKTNSGAIQLWSIVVTGSTIVTTFGQVGGKLQTTKDTVKSGKNSGRKNETDPAEQALKEAESQWTKKKKAGYVENIGAAKQGQTDKIIEGGILPMLAKVYEEHIGKVTYPIAVQPKLDGHRCIAVIGDDGEVGLWTRTRKRITSVPQIEERLKFIAKKLGFRGVILDGELYNHTLKDDFEKITSAARKKEATEASKEIQYHIYDMISPDCFKTRIGNLAEIVLVGGTAVELVATKFAESEEEAAMYFTLFKKLGYEGSMVRLLGRGYENKRSDQLLKAKDFSDAEFTITGIEEGRGKLQGHVGSFICKTEDGKKFNVKMSGETAKLKRYFENHKLWENRELVVQFQGRTSDNIPRFPVGIRFREDL